VFSSVPNVAVVFIHAKREREIPLRVGDRPTERPINRRRTGRPEDTNTVRNKVLTLTSRRRQDCFYQSNEIARYRAMVRNANSSFYYRRYRYIFVPCTHIHTIGFCI